MNKILTTIIFLLLLLTMSTTCNAQDIYWYPSYCRPQLFMRGAVAGQVTTIQAVLVEWTSPPPSYVIFIVGPYQSQYVSAFPYGVLHIPYHSMWLKEYYLFLPPDRILEFNLLSNVYIHSSLKGYKFAVQFYIEYDKERGNPGKPHVVRWLSYPRIVEIM